MENYYILNRETGKLELHFEKSVYAALDDGQKEKIKSAFLWGRRSGCWISRAKEPNLYFATRIAESLGLDNAGESGERLTFAEQMDRKAERAERRAERYEDHAAAAEQRGHELQKPIEEMHGDIAFFTQPNINTNAGRSFTNRRNRMFAAFEKGFDEFRKSEYWKGRAETARAAADKKELKDCGFVQRRIDERKRDIRALKRNIEECESILKALNEGKTPVDRHGWTVNSNPEKVQKNLDYWLDRLEIKLDELGFYQSCMDEIGGVQFSAENVKPGDIVKIWHGWTGKVISTGPKNIKIESSGLLLTYRYAEILKIVKHADDNAAESFQDENAAIPFEALIAAAVN